MSIRNYSNTAAQSTLTANVGATDTSIALTGYSGDPTPPFTAALARGTATEELVLVTAVVGSTVTVTRGYDGTAAQAQAAGATFQEVVVALDFREANNHVNATGAVHGAGSQLVGVSDTQTLTNKTLTAPHVSDLTGTGATTLAATTVTTLAVSGASSLTSLNVSGAATFSGAVTIPSLELTTQAEFDQLTAQPTVIAGKQQLWGKTDGGLYVGAARLSTYWGAGTTFPSAAVAGDTCVRTDVGPGVLFRRGSGGWRLAEQFAVADLTARNAIPAGVLHEGFEVFITAQGQVNFYDGSAWRGTRAIHGYGGTFITSGSTVTVASQDTVIATGATIPDPGWAYRLSGLFDCELYNPLGSRWDMSFEVAPAAGGAATFLLSTRPAREDDGWRTLAVPPGAVSQTFTGSQIPKLVAHQAYGSASAGLTPYFQVFGVSIWPA